MSLAFEAVLETASEVVEALRKAERRSVRWDCRSTARETAKDMTSSLRKDQEITQTDWGESQRSIECVRSMGVLRVALREGEQLDLEKELDEANGF